MRDHENVGFPSPGGKFRAGNATVKRAAIMAQMHISDLAGLDPLQAVRREKDDLHPPWRMTDA